MEEVFQPYHVFINHRGPDVKRNFASLIYRDLQNSGLRVFLDKQELQGGDSLIPTIKSAICSASVQIAIFSKTYAQSVWCLNELLWMLESHSSKIIPIFCDIKPSDLRYVDKGAYAGAFQDHRDKGRVEKTKVDSWIRALDKVSHISGVVINTEEDDYGERLEEIVKIVLKEVRREGLDEDEYTVGLNQAAKQFEKEVLSSSEINDIKVVGIVGPGGSGKSTLVTRLYNEKHTQFKRSCFLSEVSKRDLPSLQRTLLMDLLRDQNLRIEDTHRGRSLLRDRLRGLTGILIVFDDIVNTEQIENLLFVKDVVGNGSLILVTSKDKDLLVRSKIEKIYGMKLLDEKDAEKLFCWHAFRHGERFDDCQDMVKELVNMCGGFPLALKVLGGEMSKRDRRHWKWLLQDFRENLPDDILEKVVQVSYESLNSVEKEAFLDVAHFLVGEERDLVERVLDGLNGRGVLCLESLHQKCLVEFEDADIVRPEQTYGESVVWRRAKGSFKIKMHDLVRDLARQIGRQAHYPVRLCCSNDKIISPRSSIRRDEDYRSVRQYDVRGIRRYEDHQLPDFLQNQDICGLKLLVVQNSIFLQQFNSMSGDLIWFCLRQSECIVHPYFFSGTSLNNLIPSTLLLRSLRVLEVQGVNPRDFCNFFDNCEPPSQLRELTVTCTHDCGCASTAGPSDSVQPPVDLGHWFQAWLGKLNWKNLVKIVLQIMKGVETLPITFEEVRNLRHVDLSGCRYLEVLPNSFTEELLQLQYLALRDCTELVLQDLGRISTLEYLDLEGCSKLKELPRGTEVQKSLKYLNVLRTKLTKLPQHFEQLENLEELQIGSPLLRDLPPSLYKLKRLTDLTLSGCTNLCFIDNSIEQSVHLECFRIYDCGVVALPERIAWTNIKFLDVQMCELHLLQWVIGGDSGKMIEDSSHGAQCVGELATKGGHHNRPSCLTNLIMRMNNIYKVSIPCAGCLFPKLEILDLSHSFHLREIESLPGSLINLKLNNCIRLKTLTCLSNLARLKSLDISRCGELETLNVEGLNTIEVFKGNECWKLDSIQGLGQLPKLSHFQISVNNLPRSGCTDIMCGAPNLSTAVLSGKTRKMEDVDEMDRVARGFGGVRVLKVFSGCNHVSLDLELGTSAVKLKDTVSGWFEGIDRVLQGYSDYNQVSGTSAVKLKGAILLYLITIANCDVEITVHDRAYPIQFSCFNKSVHILMWTEDSEVFKDFKFSSDEALRFNIKLLDSPDPLISGFIVEAKNSKDCKQLIRYLLVEDYI